MPTIQAQGITTYYERVGKGPVLILLHGWANTWEAWLPIIPALSDHYTLVLPDLPGCGKTQTPKTGWSTAMHAQWLDDVIAQVLPSAKTNFSLIGHSYGGKIIIWQQTEKKSRRASACVLLDTSGIPNPVQGKTKTFQALASKTKQLNTLLPQELRDWVYRKLSIQSDYIGANPFQQATLKLVLGENVTDRLSFLLPPTLLIWGKQDVDTPLWQGEAMHSKIPNNEMLVVDTGHFPHHEQPGTVANRILSYLQPYA